jgi:hypothetical protein
LPNQNVSCEPSVDADAKPADEKLRLEPVWNLESLNTRFWQWLEKEYHRRAHSVLGGQYPADRFAQKATALRQLPSDNPRRLGKQIAKWTG